MFITKFTSAQIKKNNAKPTQPELTKPTPTKLQTIQWIVDKIKNNIKGKGAFNYKFVGFDAVNNILTINEKWTPSSGSSPEKYIDLLLYLNRITYFSYMEASGANVICATYPNRPDVAAVCENRFSFSDCIDENGEDDLYARMEKAFTTIKNYNKAEKRNQNEPF